MANRAKRLITMFSPSLPESSARICSMVRPSYLSALTCCWSMSVTSSSHLRSLPSAMRGRTFSGLSAACCSKTRVSASLSSCGTSSADTQRMVGMAASCIAMALAKSTNSGLRATKSVLQSTSTSTPTFALEWM